MQRRPRPRLGDRLRVGPVPDAAGGRARPGRPELRLLALRGHARFRELSVGDLWQRLVGEAVEDQKGLVHAPDAVLAAAEYAAGPREPSPFPQAAARRQARAQPGWARRQRHVCSIHTRLGGISGFDRFRLNSSYMECASGRLLVCLGRTQPASYIVCIRSRFFPPSHSVFLYVELNFGML